MVSFLYAIVAFLIIEAIIHKSLELSWSNFTSIFCKVVDLIVFIDLGPLEIGEVLFS